MRGTKNNKRISSVFLSLSLIMSLFVNGNFNVRAEDGEILSDEPIVLTQEVGETEPISSAEPTAEPSVQPTEMPEQTAEPTVEPTSEPTVEPTAEPTALPVEDVQDPVINIMDAPVVGNGSESSNITMVLSGDTEYLSGQTVTMNLTLRNSGATGSSDASYIIVDIPYRKATEMNLDTASDIVERFEVTQGTDESSIKIYLNTIPVGTNLTFPVHFKTDSPYRATETVTVTAKLYSESDPDQPIDESSHTMTITSNPNNTIRLSNNGPFEHFDVRDGDYERTSTEVSETRSVNYIVIGRAINYSGYGNYYTPFYKVTLTLTDNAYYVAEENTGWTYDETTRTLTKYVNYRPSRYDLNIANVYLHALDAPYNQNTAMFTAQIEPCDSEQKVIGVNSSTTTVYAKPLLVPSTPGNVFVSKQGSLDEYSYVNSNRDKVVTWNVYGGIYTDKNEIWSNQTVITEIHDKELNTNLYYESVMISTTGSQYVNSSTGTAYPIAEERYEGVSITLYGITNDDQEVVIDTNIQPNQRVMIEDTSREYKALYLKFGEGLLLESGERSEAIKVQVQTKVLPAIWDDPQAASDSGLFNTSLVNRAHVEFTNTSHSAEYSTPTDSDYIRIRSGGNAGISRVNVQTGRKDDQSNLTLHNGNSGYIDEISRVTFSVVARGGRQVEVGDQMHFMENGKVVIFIPDGWQFESAYFNNKTFYTSDLIYNYLGTGRTALELPIIENYTYEATSYSQNLTVDLKRTANTPLGSAYVVAYMVWDNNVVLVPNNATSDRDDLNQNGDTTDRISTASAQLVYNTGEQVYGQLYIATGLYGNYSSKEVTTFGADQNFLYRMNITNNTNEPIKQLDIINVLPYAGDTTITSNSSGTYDARGSEMTTPITGGDISSSNYYTYTFSTDMPGQTVEENLQKTFKSASEITDWSEVTMIRIKMNDGFTLAPGTTSFHFPATFGSDVPGTIAYDSFAFSTDGVNYTEVSKRGVQIEADTFSISGVAYYDYSFNGQMNENETFIQNVKVGLFDQSGVQIAETTTDENGAYVFNVEQAGVYTVRVLDKPEPFVFETAVADSRTIFPNNDMGGLRNDNGRTYGNQIDETGSGKKINLSGAYSDAICDIALQVPLTNVSITKQWENIEKLGANRAFISAYFMDADGQWSYGAYLSQENNWTDPIKYIRAYDENLQPTVLSPDELTESMYFETSDPNSKELTFETISITGDIENGFVLKNKFVDALTDVTFEKKWLGDTTKDSVIIYVVKEITPAYRRMLEDVASLMDIGEVPDKDYIVTETVELSADNNWKATAEIALYDFYGTAYNIFVVEESDLQNENREENTWAEMIFLDSPEQGEIEGYKVKVEGDTDSGFVITNTNGNYFAPVEVDPPVSKTITGDTPDTDETFTFRMVGTDNDFEKEMSITGPGEVEFGFIEYTEAGTYTYEISEVNDSAEGYTYDTTVYTMTVVVTENQAENKLEAVRTIVNQDGEISEGAVFTNAYKNPTPTPSVEPTPTATPSVTPTPTVPTVPNTSDPTGILRWGVSAIVALLFGIFAVRQLRN